MPTTHVMTAAIIHDSWSQKFAFFLFTFIMPTDWNRTPHDSPPKLADLQFRKIAKSANFDNQISDFGEIISPKFEISEIGFLISINCWLID